jgi:hypothetical protein
VDTFGIIVVVALVAVAVFWWLRRRATPPPIEDVWELPPATGSRPAAPPVAQILDRDAVLGGKPVFDSTKWDDSPEGEQDATAAEPEPGELPRFFDRDYLERKQRGESPTP